MSLVDITDKERALAGRVDSAVTGSLTVSDATGGIAFRDASQVLEFAKLMAVANSGVRTHLRGNPGACLAICVQAVEWGLSPFAVANKSYFVNDQIAFESQLVQAVILKRAPIKGRIHFEFDGEGDSRRCRAWARLRDEDEVVEYLSPKLKDITPKNSPLWKADTDQQMCYSAGRALCRRHFPDVLLGVYADDELPPEPPAVGPDRARDVTPPRSMQAKLDALAAGPEPKTEPQPEVVDHDPETGEVQQSQAVPEADTTEATTAPADDAEPETPHDRVLRECRSRVMAGERVAKVLNTISGEDRALLSDDVDVKGLKDAEKAMANA